MTLLVFTLIVLKLKNSMPMTVFRKAYSKTLDIVGVQRLVQILQKVELLAFTHEEVFHGEYIEETSNPDSSEGKIVKTTWQPRWKVIR